MRAVRYALDEALSSLWRGRESGALSTATIAVALFVLGAFLLVTTNLQRLAVEWSRAAEMSVYLDDDVGIEGRTAVEQALAPGPVVAGFDYLSKEEALRRFKQTFTDLADAAEALDSNPLPASYEVRLEASASTAGGVDALADTLRQMPGVADVRYDRQWIDRLQSAVNVVRGIGLVLGAVLVVAAGLTVANVVRLSLNARRDEIDIMQLVGAPRAYIRGPFVMEGVIQGGLGALVSLATLAVVFLAIRARYLLPLAEAVNLSAVRFLSLEISAALLLGGMAVGCLGGLFAASGRT
jgi:cell division transport system permease protein